MTERLHVVTWFVLCNTADHPTGWDRGRKAHADEAAAARHYRQIVAHAQQQLLRQGDDPGACRLQHVEYAVHNLADLPLADLVAAAVDDHWTEPGARQRVYGHDNERRAWCSSRRVISYWRGNQQESDHDRVHRTAARSA